LILPVLGNRTSLKRIGFKVPKEFKMANVVGEKETAKDKEAEQKSGVREYTNKYSFNLTM